MIPRLKAKLAFDEAAAQVAARECLSRATMSPKMRKSLGNIPEVYFVFGAEWQHARLEPLHAALLECVAALECIKHHDYGRADIFDTAKNTMDQALAQLKEKIDE